MEQTVDITNIALKEAFRKHDIKAIKYFQPLKGIKGGKHNAMVSNHTNGTIHSR